MYSSPRPVQRGGGQLPGLLGARLIPADDACPARITYAVWDRDNVWKGQTRLCCWRHPRSLLKILLCTTGVFAIRKRRGEPGEVAGTRELDDAEAECRLQNATKAGPKSTEAVGQIWHVAGAVAISRKVKILLYESKIEAGAGFVPQTPRL